MKLESLQCNNCGADIEVSAQTRFATCAHCGSKLAVVRTASAAYTELADKMSELSDRMRDHIQRTDRRGALEDLQREWEREREKYMVSSKHGVRHIPTRTESAIAGTVVTIFGAFWTLMALGITGGMRAVGGPGVFGLVGCLFPAFGVLFIGLGIYQSFSAYDKAGRYERAEAEYQKRRQALLADLDDREAS
jgi:predicted phage tail protein